MNYTSLVEQEEAQNIAIDFDGVIHTCDMGFYDGTIYGDPIPGSIDAIKNLSKKYNIIIYTAKAKHDRPLVNGKTGVQLIHEWLDKHGLSGCISYITAEKPRCICYIDDKAIHFKNWTQTLTDMNRQYKINID